MPRLHFPLVLSAIALLIQPLVHVQAATILPTTLPACAAKCTTLTNAQTSCESNPSAAGSCFCQSALLTGLKTSSAAAAICPNCDAADIGTISAWYTKFCANGGIISSAAPKVVTVTSTTNTAANAPAATANEAAAATSGIGGPSPLNDNESGPAWWHDHWKWVLMVIILAIAFGTIGVVGAIVFKRRKRAREGMDEPRPDMTAWAPGSQHNVHDFAGPAPFVPSGAATPVSHQQPQGTAKGKEREVVAGVATVPIPAGEVRSKKGNKIRKALGRA